MKTISQHLSGVMFIYVLVPDRNGQRVGHNWRLFMAGLLIFGERFVGWVVVVGVGYEARELSDYWSCTGGQGVRPSWGFGGLVSPLLPWP